MGEKNRRIRLENESGWFSVDQNGQLIEFDPAGRENTPFSLNFLPVKCERAVRHLHIPEGVRFIGNGWVRSGYDDLRSMLVVEDVSLPASLLSIGNHAFSGCLIDRIVFPPNLRKIGCGSFSGTLINHLIIQKEVLQYDDQDMDEKALLGSTEDRLIFGGRSFKESTIQEAAVASKNLSVFTPGNSRLGIIPETKKRSPEEWIKWLMPEAEVLNIRCAALSFAGKR